MATKEDTKRERDEDESPSDSEPSTAERAPREPDEASAEEEGEGAPEATEDEKKAAEADAEPAEAPGAAPRQLGSRRFVYAAYFAGAIAVGFVASKVVGFGWQKLSAWKPAVGQPQEELVMVISGVIGIGTALYYWFRLKTRRLAEDVAEELSKVTWPSRREVTNGTTVVIVATAFATIFFALMDRFWAFVTNEIYN